jgi:hypothetical protein
MRNPNTTKPTTSTSQNTRGPSSQGAREQTGQSKVNTISGSTSEKDSKTKVDKTKPTDKTDLKASFIKKVNLAKTVYDYSDENKDSKQKTERQTAINELIEMLGDQRLVTTLFIPHIDLVIEMITKNIFRPLPCLKKNNLNLGMQETGVEPDEQESDPAWPHIRGVYEIFLQLIVNEACDVKSFKSFITNNFISEVNNFFIFSFSNYLIQRNLKNETF